MAVARVAVIGGSPMAASVETIRLACVSCDAVVAIDRGFDAARAAEVDVDLFCGDADSVSAAGSAAVRAAEDASACDEAPFAVVRYDPHKDDTDLGLALAEIGRRWSDAHLVCTCMSGGNPDHELAVLGRLATWPGAVEVYEDTFVQRLLKAGERWDLAGHLNERFTFIPLSPSAVVSETGMRWNLDHERVPLLSDLGVSNVVDTPEAHVTCHEGVISAWSFKGHFAGA